MGHQFLEKGEFPTGKIITFQVMAFAGMSPGYPDSVGPFPQGGQGKLGVHSSRTGDPDHADMRWIFHPADAGKIRRTVTAPVAQKGNNLRFPFRHMAALSL
jgi:hypothetical protein